MSCLALSSLSIVLFMMYVPVYHLGPGSSASTLPPGRHGRSASPHVGILYVRARWRFVTAYAACRTLQQQRHVTASLQGRGVQPDRRTSHSNLISADVLSVCGRLFVNCCWLVEFRGCQGEIEGRYRRLSGARRRYEQGGWSGMMWSRLEAGPRRQCLDIRTVALLVPRPDLLVLRSTVKVLAGGRGL
ncbi:hypothetical protein BDV98DRAFT_113465 [Pterulicium gracile]|uniref:Secreted protein n=1 Tax=Pterulicium gracile TaxID=1884261 RepID=A0A5C3QE77_9AGAR|nr:hypothetical protein BDV98DRAFT_113465 [Pterula gracilis]